MAQHFDVAKKTYVVVTGASKGIGAAIALELSKLLKHSTFALFARSGVGLEQVNAQIAPTGNHVSSFRADLSKPDVDYFTELFANVSNDFEQKIIFHNAGEIGTLDKTRELFLLDKWQRYYDLNLFSAAILNAIFLKTLPDIPTFVVNVTSLCGSVPFSNMSMYGSAKAARNLLFKVLAVEEPSIVVLNYSPGPVDTDMVTEVIANMKDLSVRSLFTDLIENATILTPAATVARLLRILVVGGFKSGDLIDFYDGGIDVQDKMK